MYHCLKTMDLNVNSKSRYTVCSLIWSEISLIDIVVNVNSLIYVFNGNICVVWCSSYVLMYMCMNKLQCLCGMCVWERERDREGKRSTIKSLIHRNHNFEIWYLGNLYYNTQRYTLKLIFKINYI